MLNFNINLTSLAVILWSGMLIISGSIWVLCSQVRKLADILEDHAERALAVEGPVYEARLVATATCGGRVTRRGAPVRLRGRSRTTITGSRGQGQLIAPRRSESATGGASSTERSGNRADG